MRWRAAAAALGVAVLAASVVVLRSEVAPPERAAAPVDQQAAHQTAGPGLPVRDPVRTPRWRVFTPPARTLNGVVGAHYLANVRQDRGRMAISVVSRDSGEQVLEHTVQLDQLPWNSLLHAGFLLVSHGQAAAALTVVDPATGQSTRLQPPQGHGFGTELVPLGDEVLVVGSKGDRQRSCILAVRPTTGAVRVAWCLPQATTLGWLYSGAGDVVWPVFTDPPTPCPRWYRLQAVEQVRPVTPGPTPCGVRELIDMAGWRVVLEPQRDAAHPLLTAGDGARRVVLGTAPTMVACGRHVYWAAPPGGTAGPALYRWLPGADHREVVYQLDPASRRGLAAPRCTEGVLSVGVTVGSGPRVVELRSLGRP